MKNFILKNLFTTRILLSIIVICIIPAAILFSISTIKKLRIEADKERTFQAEKKLQKDLFKVKVLDTIYPSQIGVHRAFLKTKYISGSLKFQFTADLVDDKGIRVKAITPIPTNPNYLDVLNIDFLDKDGFQIAHYSLLIENLTNVVNIENKKIGYSYNGEFELSKDLYFKINSWELGWQF